MSNIARVRVELKNKYSDPERNFKEMFQDFKRKVNNSGIMHEFKEHQYFESPQQKKRKKRNEARKKQVFGALERQILAGKRVKAPSGIVKRILNTDKRKRGDNV